MAREKKRGFRFSRFMLLIILIVVIGLAWYFGLLKGFGLGAGRGADKRNAESPDINSRETRQVESQANPIEPSSPTKYILEVNGDQYSLNGQRLNLDQLEKELDQLAEDSRLELVDDDAIQNAYQQVLDILTKHGIAYSEIKN